MHDPAVGRPDEDLPVILLVDDNDATLLSTVERRYGHDYEVLAEASADHAMNRLQRLHDDGRQVALLIADHWMPGESGAAFLARSRRLHPTAQRLLTSDWGDLSTIESTVQAMLLGEIETWVGRPLDDHGFIVTGPQRERPDDGFGLATTMPGVFAAGDVRSSPVKRVAAAVGDGSSAIREIHQFRAQRPREGSAAR